MYPLGPDQPSRAGSFVPAGLLTVDAVRYVRKLCGGSQSVLVRCEDDRLYAVKCNHNVQGRNLLANELLGSVLMNGLGIPTPVVRRIYVSKRFIDDNAQMGFELPHGARPIAAGYHFGSLFLDQEGSTSAVDGYDSGLTSVPSGSAAYAFDVLVNHRDRRNVIYRQSRRVHGLEMFYVDNGHILGGPNWLSLDGPMALRAERSWALWSLDLRSILDTCLRFQTILPPVIEHAFSIVPPEWHGGDLPFVMERLLSRLRCLEHLIGEAWRSRCRNCASARPSLCFPI